MDEVNTIVKHKFNFNTPVKLINSFEQLTIIGIMFTPIKGEVVYTVRSSTGYTFIVNEYELEDYA